jgi:hypothetical protein
MKIQVANTLFDYLPNFLFEINLQVQNTLFDNLSHLGVLMCWLSCMPTMQLKSLQSYSAG